MCVAMVPNKQIDRGKAKHICQQMYLNRTERERERVRVGRKKSVRLPHDTDDGTLKLSV